MDKQKQHIPTTEERVAQVILQQSDTELVLGGRTYHVTPATPATLFLVSSLVSQLPKVDPEAKNALSEVLRIASQENIAVIGKIAAALILGAKRIREHRTVSVVTGYRHKWSWRHFRRVDCPIRKRVSEYEHVAELVLQETTIETLSQVITRRLMDMQVGSFFGLTTSLSGLNITRATQEVEATAHGE